MKLQELTVQKPDKAVKFPLSAEGMSYIAKFFRFSIAEQRLLLEAATLLGLARLAIIALPFRWVAAVLGERRTHILDASGANSEKITALPVSRVAWAIWLTGRHTPWRSNCLAKAVAGRLMLRRRGIGSTLYFGMAKDEEGKFEAHAWLSSDGVILTGGAESDRYSVLAEFVG